MADSVERQDGIAMSARKRARVANTTLEEHTTDCTANIELTGGLAMPATTVTLWRERKLLDCSIATDGAGSAYPVSTPA